MAGERPPTSGSRGGPGAGRVHTTTLSPERKKLRPGVPEPVSGQDPQRPLARAQALRRPVRDGFGHLPPFPECWGPGTRP